ncbi:MAG: GNAT family N-acetyltransferase [Pseudonocardiaceae bacterium]
MASLPSDLSFQRFDTAGARVQRDTVEIVYCDAYAEQMASGGAFESAEAAMIRFDAYTSRDGFDLVIGYLNGEPVGQTWGWALTPTSAWWRGLLVEPEPGFTVEDGTRTFALSEVMVRRNWIGRGIAHALHDELLRDRSETRATLLVRPDNVTAYGAYTRWGWHKVAQLRPGWPDAPLLDVLMLSLPVGQ